MVPRSYLTVEVKPEGKGSPSKRSPASPPLSPGKSVRFVDCVKSEARALEHVEQWSLYNFEIHARRCATCLNPEGLFHGEKQLCATGQALALDLRQHIHIVDGHPCSTRKQNHKYVRVDIPADHSSARQLLYSDSSLFRRKSDRSDKHRPVLGRRQSPERIVDGLFAPSSPRFLYAYPSHRPLTPDSASDYSSSSDRRHSRAIIRSPVYESYEVSPHRYESYEVSPDRGYRVEVVKPARKSSKRNQGARTSGSPL